jgi:hypothetical protein
MDKTFKKFWANQIQKAETPRTFSMVRNFDESGVSGIGKVLDGVIFPCGKVAVCWDPVNPTGNESVNSVAVFDTFEAFLNIHVDAHPDNGTDIIFNP